MSGANGRPRSQSLLRVATLLYGVGMIILLWPVSSDLPYDVVDVPREGQFSSDGFSLCGVTLTAAFVAPAEDDGDRERKADCAAKASDRIGYGLLALAVAAPFAVSGVAGRQ